MIIDLSDPSDRIALFALIFSIVSFAGSIVVSFIINKSQQNSAAKNTAAQLEVALKTNSEQLKQSSHIATRQALQQSAEYFQARFSDFNATFAEIRLIVSDTAAGTSGALDLSTRIGGLCSALARNLQDLSVANALPLMWVASDASGKGLAQSTKSIRDAILALKEKFKLEDGDIQAIVSGDDTGRDALINRLVSDWVEIEQQVVAISSDVSYSLVMTVMELADEALANRKRFGA